MKIKLKQAFDLQMGKTPARNQAENWGGNHRWVSIADIGNAEKYIAKTKECITDAGINASGIKVVPQGTVIMSFKLSIGKTAITAQDMYTNEAIIAFIDKKIFEIDPNYLYHLCCGTDWTAGTNKAVMGLTLNKATLLEKEISLPDICQQRKIAAKLDKIDAIIADRQQQLTMIEQAVKSRFIELFGDPVSATKEEKVELLELCEKITDGEHGSVARISEGHPFLNAKHILKNGNIDWDTITFIGELEHQRIYKRCNPEPGDILLTTTGTIGNVAIMPECEEVSMDRGITLLKINHEKVTSEFVAELLRQDSVQIEMRANVHASAIGHLFMNKVKKLPAILPAMDRQMEFTKFVKQTDKSKLAVQQGLQELETLKKSLMQQYFG